jgi:hypothetical protein
VAPSGSVLVSAVVSTVLGVVSGPVTAGVVWVTVAVRPGLVDDTVIVTAGRSTITVREMIVAV